MLIDTGRSTFPTDLDESYYLQKNNNRKKKNEDNSFIAISKFLPAKGVTVRLDNGTVLSYKGSQMQEGSKAFSERGSPTSLKEATPLQRQTKIFYNQLSTSPRCLKTLIYNAYRANQ